MTSVALIVWKKPMPPSMLGVALPSGESAQDFIAQKPGSTIRLLLHWFARSLIVGAGMAVAGARGMRLVKYALVGGTAIEAAVLYFAWRNKGEALPSGENASDMIERKPGSFLRMVGILIGRALEIGAGLWIAGARGKDLVKYSFAGSAAVEAFVQVFALLFHEPTEKKS